MSRVAPALLVLFLTGCSERWDAYVYPDKSNLTRHVFAGTYGSFIECRNASIEALAAMKAVKHGDFECGLNCRGDTFPKTCEKTRKF